MTYHQIWRNICPRRKSDSPRHWRNRQVECDVCRACSVEVWGVKLGSRNLVTWEVWRGGILGLHWLSLASFGVKIGATLVLPELGRSHLLGFQEFWATVTLRGQKWFSKSSVMWLPRNYLARRLWAKVIYSGGGKMDHGLVHSCFCQCW